MILMMGPTGSGKSSQTAELVKRHHQLVGIEMGELLRQSHDPQAQAAMQSGHFVSDELSAQLLRAALHQAGDREPLLDGYPRRVSQLADFEQMLVELKQSVRAVIVLRVSRAIAEERLAKRGRADDVAVAIATRWLEFEQETMQVVEHFMKQGVVHEVDGEGDLEVITGRIEKALGLDETKN
ncbi:nucleoside monophosphate kinase [Candidatus Microgenomates bacterium]|nr:nucleoside monophosphate kinase [Candidatus Microgenomates bacterium]